MSQVATRRTRTAGKVDIPSVDDHISKLEHMGKETVKKLQDIRSAAQQAGVDIDIPENSVQRGETRVLSNSEPKSSADQARGIKCAGSGRQDDCVFNMAYFADSRSLSCSDHHTH